MNIMFSCHFTLTGIITPEKVFVNYIYFLCMKDIFNKLMV